MSDFAFDDDEEDAEYERPRTRRVRSSPLRWVTPGTFGLAAILFFLPWTDLSCNGPTGRVQLVSQSGMQSAAGTYSEGEAIRELRERKAKGGAKPGMDGLGELNLNPKGDGKKDGPDAAPILWVYLAMLLAGAGVAVAPNRLRGAMVTGFAAVSLLVLLLQVGIGLPLPKAAAESNEKMEKAGPAGGAVLKVDNMDELREMARIRSSYLPSFWISIVVLLASLTLGIIQLALGDGKPERRRRRPRDDDED
jgi:hypothetical protein